MSSCEESYFIIKPEDFVAEWMITRCTSAVRRHAIFHVRIKAAIISFHSTENIKY
jgi:hypothetical protein